MVDAIKDLPLIRTLKSQVEKPLVFNQIAGGKSPACSLKKLKEAGVSLVIYSTPCLFAAQDAVEDAMKSLKEHDGLLQEKGSADLKSCTSILNENLARRDEK